MCDVAPFAMKCIYEEKPCLKCATHHLYCALNELLLDIPIIKNVVHPYRCCDFMFQNTVEQEKNSIGKEKEDSDDE